MTNCPLVLLLTILFSSLLFFLCFVNVIISFFYFVCNFYSIKFRFQSYRLIGKPLLTLLSYNLFTGSLHVMTSSQYPELYFKTLQILIIGLLIAVHNPHLILNFNGHFVTFVVLRETLTIFL